MKAKTVLTALLALSLSLGVTGISFARGGGNGGSGGNAGGAATGFSRPVQRDQMHQHQQTRQTEAQQKNIEQLRQQNLEQHRQQKAEQRQEQIRNGEGEQNRTRSQAAYGEEKNRSGEEPPPGSGETDADRLREGDRLQERIHQEPQETTAGN